MEWSGGVEVETETEGQRQRDRERERDRGTERERQRDRERERQRQRHRQTVTETETQTDSGRAIQSGAARDEQTRETQSLKLTVVERQRAPRGLDCLLDKKQRGRGGGT